MKHLYSLLTVLLFSFLFYASTQVQHLQTTQTQYEDVPRKQTEPITVSYTEPVIVPVPETVQLQHNGNISISCEIVPFSVDSITEQKKTLAIVDPKKINHDVYEVRSASKYIVTPNEVRFVIRIKNNQDRILKLNDVALVSIVDGIQYSIPAENLTDWKNGLIVKNFEKSYTITGPSTSFLKNAKVIYFSINDVPVEYDQAGNIIKKENFEWFFACSQKTVSKQDYITYNYEYVPVEEKKCLACDGRGSFTKEITCPTCSGAGKLRSKYDGSIYTCRACSGTGRQTRKDICNTCHSLGIEQLPKSPRPNIAKDVNWSGWQVEVKSIPLGAKISTVDVTTGEYKAMGTANKKIDWYSSDEKVYPIVLEYQDKTVKVLPYTSSGKPSPVVMVDFRNKPVIKKGQKAE